VTWFVRPLSAALLVGVASTLVGPGVRPASAQKAVSWSAARSDSKPVKAGGPVNVDLTARIDDGWHLYALTQVSGGPNALVISVPKDQPFALSGPIEAPVPKTEFDPNFSIDTQFHAEAAVFTLPLKVAAGTKDGRHKFRAVVAFQVCNDKICLPPTEEELTVEIPVGTVANASATPGATPGAAGPGTAETGATGTTPSTAPSTTPGTTPARAAVPDLAASSRANTLGAYIGLAALMGALSLLTPCVFPMVPITVSYFTNRPGRTRKDAITQALVYGLGIVLTFSALGFVLALVFGASGLNRFAADPWLNLGVTALFVAFALSLFGIWELTVPSKLLTAVSKADEGRGRFIGTALMGLAFTLTSFTCTAPFLGTLLVVAAQGDWQWPLAGMLAFSGIFALPFVGLAIAPHLVSSLPRSGSWLVAVKASMGLLELAAAMKFLSNVDLVWGWNIFTRDVVLVSWVVIALILVAYLAGFIRLGYAPKLGRPRLMRLTAAAAGVAVALWLTSGLTGRRLGELEAFLPPADLAGAHGGELPWIMNDFEGAIAQARRENRPVMVDFTGYTCTNCRWMEANMFTRPEISRYLARYVRVRLYTDGKGEIYKKQQQLEESLFGTVALPYYAAFDPAGQPKVAFGGLTRNPDEFLAFLQRGLE
jgi:thiol:disulfide interchange protein DsbD